MADWCFTLWFGVWWPNQWKAKVCNWKPVLRVSAEGCRRAVFYISTLGTRLIHRNPLSRRHQQCGAATDLFFNFGSSFCRHVSNTISTVGWEPSLIGAVTKPPNFFNLFFFFNKTQRLLSFLYGRCLQFENWSTKRIKVTTGPAQIGIIRLKNPH